MNVSEALIEHIVFVKYVPSTLSRFIHKIDILASVALFVCLSTLTQTYSWNETENELRLLLRPPHTAII